MNPKVSVHFITHNQELFVGKALESVLAQVTNFSFEIVIGEDASTDKTGEICDELIKKGEIPVKIFHHTENLGYLGNFMFTLEQCTGDYIALLEGDDFWTDPMKLQKQVDLLESEEQSVIAFSRVLIVDETETILSESHGKQMPSSPGIGLLMKGNFGFTASCMFRNLFRVDSALLSLMRKYATELPVLDYPLYLLMAERGRILFSNDILAAYRVHRHSLWNAMKARDHLGKNIQVIDVMSAYFRPIGSDEFRAGKSNLRIAMLRKHSFYSQPLQWLVFFYRALLSSRNTSDYTLRDVFWLAKENIMRRSTDIMNPRG